MRADPIPQLGPPSSTSPQHQQSCTQLLSQPQEQGVHPGDFVPLLPSAVSFHHHLEPHFHQNISGKLTLPNKMRPLTAKLMLRG